MQSSGPFPQFATFPVFRDSVIQSDRIFKRIVGKSLIYDYGLFGPHRSSIPLPDPWPADLTLPSLAVFQVAMFELLIHVGVEPDMVMGHSAGETTLLYGSGGGSREMVIELAIARGIAFRSIEEASGTMAALSCTAADASRLIRLAHCDGVDIACYNSSSAVAISGNGKEIDQVLSFAAAEGITATKLKTKVPVHSAMMELCRVQYQSLVGDVFAQYNGARKPQIPTISTLTGKSLFSAFDAKYFWDNARSAVRFTDAMETATRMIPNSVFIEISPHPVLSSYIQDQTALPHQVLSCACRPRKEQGPAELSAFLQMLGNLTIYGYNAVHFHRVHPSQQSKKSRDRSSFMEYPFARKAFPLYSDMPSMQKQLEPHNGPLNHKYLRINQDTHPSLAEHIIRGEPIMPAGGFIEMVFEFGATCLINVEFRSILSIAAEKPIPVQVALDGCHWTVASSGNLHAEGYLTYDHPSRLPNLDLPSIQRRCEAHHSISMYPALEYALNYGPSYKRVIEVHLNQEEALVVMKGLTEDIFNDDDYILHPVVLDASLHVLCYSQFHANLDANVYYLPDRIGRVILHHPSKAKYFPSTRLFVHHKIVGWLPDRIISDVAIADEDGVILCSLEGFLQEYLCWLSSLKQFVNIFIVGLEDSTAGLSSDLTQLLSLDLGATIAYYLYNSSQPLDCKCTWVHGRYGAVDFLQPLQPQGLHPHSFDMVVIFAESGQFSMDSESESIFAFSRQLLSPGGCVFLLTLSGPQMASPSYPSPETLDTLQRSAEEAGFMSLYRDIHDFAEGQSSFFLARFRPSLNDAVFLTMPGAADPLIYTYHEGREIDLQWFLSGLDQTKALDIWIAALCGREGDQASGLIRVLHLEYPAWRLRLAVFPSSFSKKRRADFIRTLPVYLEGELEIIVTESGGVLVPRVISCPSGKSRAVHADAIPPIPSSKLIAVVKIVAAVSFGNGYGFVGKVDGGNADYQGCLVGGITESISGSWITVEVAHLFLLHEVYKVFLESIRALDTGLAVAALAPSLSAFNQPTCLDGVRVLLTHKSSSIGRVVSMIYKARGACVVEVEADLNIFSLSSLRKEPFDLVVSGHTNSQFRQISQILLRKKSGRLFLWDAKDSGLCSITQQEPYTIRDALSSAFPLLHGTSLHEEIATHTEIDVEHHFTSINTTQQLFDPDKTYWGKMPLLRMASYEAHSRVAARIRTCSQCNIESL
ncbi:hypothetical protein D9758_015138 [Tetrapyrgos nigripes]|uniref:PKS/mFAS DH domain-containing protein n=1 Tax=Tetrapyrgos nigripes TaxID=182062 RepID=A0A8H5CQ62_9AGAR|nr:hypothetical protein D9758_015138 [Tetrapyrgos nigripes]